MDKVYIIQFRYGDRWYGWALIANERTHQSFVCVCLRHGNLLSNAFLEKLIYRQMETVGIYWALGVAWWMSFSYIFFLVWYTFLFKHHRISSNITG